jgi:hypothetical protein
MVDQRLIFTIAAQSLRLAYMKAQVRNLLLSVLLALLPQLSAPATDLNSASFDDLLSAVDAGGMIHLNFDGSIVFPKSISISHDVGIDAGNHTVIFDGQDQTRFFQVQSGVLTLRSLTLTHGKAPVDQNLDAYGGAISLLGGSLIAQKCIFLTNQAYGQVGYAINAISMFPRVYPGGAGYGGAISANGGQLTILDCGFIGNFARGAERTSTPSPWYASGYLRIAGNAAFGGAVWASCDVRVERSFFQRNFVRPGANGEKSDIGEAKGGALQNVSGSLTITNCLFDSNSVHAGSGGALDLLAPSQISSSVFISNVSTGQPHTGYFIFAFQPPVGGGGAISSSNEVTIESSIFYLNAAHGPPALNSGQPIWDPPRPTYGGAIESYRLLHVTNCVFFKNAAFGGEGAPWTTQAYTSPFGIGGAIAALPGGTVAVVHSTFAENASLQGTHPTPALTPVGAAIFSDQNAVSLTASLLGFHPSPAVAGTVSDGGWNLSADATPAFTQLSSSNNIDPRLRYPQPAFAPILALETNSPAIDLVPLSIVFTDVRGAARPLTNSDSGAFEFGAANVLAIQKADTGSITVNAGLAGEPIRLESSADLLSWETFAPIRLTNWFQQYLDITVTSERQFFREARTP